MKFDLIGEYEITFYPAAQRLEIHHVPRGLDVVQLEGAALAQLRHELAAAPLKRIRALADRHQVIFGAAGDMTIYDPAGRRACYLHSDHCAAFARLLADDEQRLDSSA